MIRPELSEHNSETSGQSLPKHPIADILAREPRGSAIRDEHRSTQLISAMGLTPIQTQAPPYRIILPSEQ